MSHISQIPLSERNYYKITKTQVALTQNICYDQSRYRCTLKAKCWSLRILWHYFMFQNPLFSLTLCNKLQRLTILLRHVFSFHELQKKFYNRDQFHELLSELLRLLHWSENRLLEMFCGRVFNSFMTTWKALCCLEGISWRKYAVNTDAIFWFLRIMGRISR